MTLFCPISNAYLPVATEVHHCHPPPPPPPKAQGSLLDGRPLMQLLGQLHLDISTHCYFLNCCLTPATLSLCSLSLKAIHLQLHYVCCSSRSYQRVDRQCNDVSCDVAWCFMTASCTPLPLGLPYATSQDVITVLAHGLPPVLRLHNKCFNACHKEVNITIT